MSIKNRLLASLVLAALGALAACEDPAGSGNEIVTRVVIGGVPTAPIVAGSSVQLNATAFTSGGSTSTGWTWRSSDTTVAVVSGAGLVTGRAAGSATIRATATGGVFSEVIVAVVGGASANPHLEFGTPIDTNPADDILLNKPEFSLSYSSARGGPNWVSWNLERDDMVSGVDRCDCFEADPDLPAGVYRVTTGNYTSGGYDRGHMVASFERTYSAEANRRTFLMTNILPQHADNNQGPWQEFESYYQDRVRNGGKEAYVISGGRGSLGTLKNEGRVTIPSHTWKIVVLMPAGQGLGNVTGTGSIEVIAIDMPNVSGIRSNGWTQYRTSVDAIEAATQYDFLDKLPDTVETFWEARSN